MPASRKQPQHARSVGLVARLAENHSIHNHYRVCTENIPARLLLRHSVRFFSRQSFCAFSRRLSGANSLVNLCGLDNEFNTRVAQDFLPSWRSRCQNNHEICNYEQIFNGLSS